MLARRNLNWRRYSVKPQALRVTPPLALWPLNSVSGYGLSSRASPPCIRLTASADLSGYKKRVINLAVSIYDLVPS
jgi:hypothetical protein